MKIHVRRRHIKAGIPRSTQECPVARAFQDATGDRPVVTYSTLRSPLGKFRLPETVRNFIARFDSGQPVKPFAFVLK